ncbi:MAG: hypothetical protein V3V00_12040 [Saprospiraceae bacterium]
MLAHIKCPYTIPDPVHWGKKITNDSCPLHNHTTFVENKGVKQKSTTKPKNGFPRHVPLPKSAPVFKSPKPFSMIKAPPLPTVDKAKIRFLEQEEKIRASNILREQSISNQNINRKLNALSNSTNRTIEGINNSIGYQKKRLSSELDALDQQRRDFEFNNPVDTEGLRNSLSNAQNVVKSSTAGIGTGALGSFKPLRRGTVSFGENTKTTLGTGIVKGITEAGSEFINGVNHYYDQAEGGIKHYYDKTEGGAKHYYDILENGTKYHYDQANGGIKYHVDKLKKSPLYKYFQERALSLFMESPDIIEVTHPDSNLQPIANSKPIYYMNGMFTDIGTAKTQAEELSGQLRRPVRLVLNKSIVDGNTGSPHIDDFSESVYDRFWPQTLGSSSLLLGGSIPFTQLNLATRWLTHILYHENEPITIVSHSQGCIITRNAILTAMLLGKENKMKNSVTWIAAGNPLHDNEVELSMPAVYFSIHREDDFVANWVGMRDGNQQGTFNAWKNGWAKEKLGDEDGALDKHLPGPNYFPFIFNLIGDTNHEDFRLFVRNNDRRYRITGNFEYKRMMPTTPTPRSGTVSFVK